MQRKVAGDRSYGAINGRFDTVMELKGKYSKAWSSKKEKYGCSSAKVFWLLQTRNVTIVEKQCHFHVYETKCIYDSSNPHCKLYFVQWYKTLSIDDFPIDNIDNVLNWNWLRFLRTIRDKRALSGSKECGILPNEHIEPVGRVVEKH